ncbi:MAG: hypothetical protein ABI551_12630 [Polyangiaceae bacterium]
MFGEERAVWKEEIGHGDNRAEAWRLSDRIAALRLTGFLDVALAKDVLTLLQVALDASPSARKLVAFCDYTALSGAEPAARQMIQEAVKAQKERFEVLHYLVSSKILALAVQIAGLWHGIPSRTWTSVDHAELELARLEAEAKA